MLSIIFLIINFKYAQAQVSSINQTLSEVKANIDLVNQYANSQKIKEAVRLSKNLYFQALLTATNNLSTKQDLSQDLFVNFSVYSYFRGIKPSIL